MDHNEENDDNEDDVEKHYRLIAAISNVRGKKQRRQRPLVYETSAEVSEFNISSSNKEKLDISDLLGGLKDTDKLGDLKKQLRVAAKRKAKVVSAPLHRQASEKVQRIAAYSEVCKDVSKWDEVVRKNRHAEQLNFPANEVQYHLCTAEDTIKRFAPRTRLEIESAKILQSSKSNLTNDVELTKAEEEILQAMSLSEAKQRRSELQKMRAVMSYHAAKLKRQKKIKSKGYHRIMKKEQRRHAVKEFEELKARDPHLAMEKLDLLEKDRVRERVTLKHRPRGKMLKRLKMHTRDPKVREALQEQLRISRELTEKHALVPNDDGTTELNADVDADVAEYLSLDQTNPWLQSSLTCLRGRDAAIGTNSAVTATQFDKLCAGTSPATVIRSVTQDASNVELLPSNAAMPAKMSRRRRKGESQDLQLGVAEPHVAHDTSPDTSVSGDQMLNKRTTSKRKSAEKSVEHADLDKIFEPVCPTTKITLDRIDIDKNVKLKPNRKEAKVHLDNQDFIEKSITSVQTPDEAMINPNEYIVPNTKPLFAIEAELIEHMESDDDQAALVVEAFADDDVGAEFLREKDAVIEQQRPKDIDLSLPGWGEWAGAGLRPNKKKKSRFILKAPQPKQRKDHYMPGVILSEKEDTAVKKLQVSDLPFPFTSVPEYEASLRQPIGKEWNPQTAHTLLVAPSLITKRGAVIKPMDKDLVFGKKGKRLDEED